MTLDEWYQKAGKTAAQFSKESGVPESDLSKYKSGKHFPRRDALSKIIAATGGSVTANDFLPETVTS